MPKLSIRRSTIEDIPQMRGIFAHAREFMASTGNPNQWTGDYPSEEFLRADIMSGDSYVCVSDGEIVATFLLRAGADPTYDVIYDGVWPDDAPYATIHRIASSGRVRGIMHAAMQFALRRHDNVRIDTHRDNVVMQNAIRKEGFSYCGVIHCWNGDERLAYQYSRKPLSFRGGRADEADFLARCVMAGIGMCDFIHEVEDALLLDAIKVECQREDSLYSYRHCLVAECDGKVVGSIISYPGEDYAELRALTWQRLNDAVGDDSADNSDFETGEGEYYLDTLAILPEFRGSGYGMVIIAEAVRRAASMGYGRVTLIVEQDHPSLISYYQSAGFHIESEMTFLGDKYFKCAMCPDKKEKYEEMTSRLESLLKDESDDIAKMANAAAEIHRTFGFWWTGFYRVNGSELILGPFQGPLACMHIPYGKGVCGTSWKEDRTVVVPDVEQFPGHIACSSESRSEIVVPVRRGGEVIAVLDIDSEHLATFDKVDAYYLERITELI